MKNYINIDLYRAISDIATFESSCRECFYQIRIEGLDQIFNIINYYDPTNFNKLWKKWCDAKNKKLLTTKKHIVNDKYIEYYCRNYFLIIFYINHTPYIYYIMNSDFLKMHLEIRRSSCNIRERELTNKNYVRSI